MRISDWSSDVCSSDLSAHRRDAAAHQGASLMDIVLRATAMFFILFLLIRLLGKRELGQMTPFELVVLVVLGDLIQQGVTHNDFSLTGATLALCTFAFWALILSWTTYLFPRAKIGRASCRERVCQSV